jgi:tripartite-type tricarboxylate transporter receptor subunit TctC
MRWKGALVAAISLAPIALEANAQKWPVRPIEMIIPFPAGSGVDVIGRAVASALADQSGQQVVVNNRDGASGTIGFNALAAATPDGSTIAFGPTTPIANAPPEPPSPITQLMMGIPITDISNRFRAIASD